MSHNLGTILWLSHTVTSEENIINSSYNISSERWTQCPQIQSSFFLSYCCSKISELNILDQFFMVFTINTMSSWDLPSPDWHPVALIVCFPLFIKQTSLLWQANVSSIVLASCTLYSVHSNPKQMKKCLVFQSFSSPEDLVSHNEKFQTYSDSQ